MYIQIVNFNLKDLSDADYRIACDGFAEVFAQVPGLISKVWLADADANTYGGVYTWVDRAAMETFLRSDLFSAVTANPHFTNIASAAFEVLERPSRVTRAPIAVAT